MTGYGPLDHARVLDDVTIYILDEMGERERASYARHLDACPSCRAEVSVLVEAACGVLSSVETPPAADLRHRLRDRLSGPRREVQPWKAWAASEIVPSTIVRSDDAAWQDSAIPGIRVRNLFVDAANDRITMLVRMEPGTAYPAHRHAGVEECYVLEGDLLVGEYRLRAGDYQRLDLGSAHGVQSTEGGCLLFIVSSSRDELLETRG